MRKLIEDTFYDRLTLRRYEGNFPVTVYEDMPCALSRNANTHSPTPTDMVDSLPVKRYRLRVYAPFDVDFELGDELEIEHYGAKYVGLASDCFKYDCYSLCVMEVEEVRYD